MFEHMLSLTRGLIPYIVLRTAAKARLHILRGWQLPAGGAGSQLVRHQHDLRLSALLGEPSGSL